MFHFKIYSNLLAAAHINNTTMTDEKLTLLDCNILCLIKSFHDSGRPFYMTNEQLAKTFLTSERTVKTSLNRLYWRNFISGTGTKKRIIKYNSDQVEAFIQKMLIQCKNCP